MRSRKPAPSRRASSSRRRAPPSPPAALEAAAAPRPAASSSSLLNALPLAAELDGKGQPSARSPAVPPTLLAGAAAATFTGLVLVPVPAPAPQSPTIASSGHMPRGRTVQCWHQHGDAIPIQWELRLQLLKQCRDCGRRGSGACTGSCRCTASNWCSNPNSQCSPLRLLLPDVSCAAAG